MDAVIATVAIVIVAAWIGWQGLLWLAGGNVPAPRRRRKPAHVDNEAFVAAVDEGRPRTVMISHVAWHEIRDEIPRAARLEFRFDGSSGQRRTRYAYRPSTEEREPAKRALAALAEAAAWRWRRSATPPSVAFAVIREPADVIAEAAAANPLPPS